LKKGMDAISEAHALAAQPLFPACKVSEKNGLFLGQMTGRHLS
jgi:hypothetical protein